MRGFRKRHPQVTLRSGEFVDRGRVNMANKKTITDYFELLKQTMERCGNAQVDDEMIQ